MNPKGQISILHLIASACLALLLAIPAQAQNLGQCASSNANLDAMVDACTRALQDELDDWKKQTTLTLSLRAYALQQKGEIERAIADLTTAIRVDANYLPAFKARGDLYRDRKLCSLGVADYSEAIRLQPDNAQNYLGRGMCFIEQKDVDRALADFDQVIKLSPTDKSPAATAWSMKALLHSTKKQFDVALADCEEAIKLQPDRADLYVERGSVWALKGNDDKAQADFDLALSRDTNNSAAIPALMEKALLHIRKHDLTSAMADYNEAIKRDPTRAPLFTERAALWRDQGANDKAAADYTRAIEIASKDPVTYNLRGGFYRDTGDYDKAVADFDKAIQLDPDAPTAYGNRGLIRFYKGDFAGAASDFGKAADSQPSMYSQIWLYLSRLRDGSTPSSQVTGEFKKASEKFSDHNWPFPVIQLYLGNQAADAALGVAKTESQKCEAQFYVGELQVLRKDRAQATSAFQNVADHCARNPTEHLVAISELQRFKK